MTPQAGQIWRWAYNGFFIGSKNYFYVLLIERETEGFWQGLDLEEGDMSSWSFNKIDMKYWEYIA